MSAKRATLPWTNRPAGWSRRSLLQAAAGLGALSLPDYLQLQAREAGSADRVAGKAKACIIVYCWGGISHLESFDLKPEAPAEFRGEFQQIPTIVPGIQISEHLPLIARHTDKLAIVRSIHHDDSAHGRGMYWNLTGHKPSRPASNLSPLPEDWPSLAAMISKFRSPPRGVPVAVRLPYPMVDNGTLQAGEYGGWLGKTFDPIMMRPAGGSPFEGSSRTLGSEVLNLRDVDLARLTARRDLLASLDAPGKGAIGYEDFRHFHSLAADILCGSAVTRAYDLDQEDPKVRELYGEHLGGKSLLLARRLTDAGVPVVQVCCAAGDLNGGAGDMWDTHGDNFNRLKKRLLPVLDRALSALLKDLSDRGTLDQTLVVLLTDFGRTPRINGGAGRDHYPSVYSVALAGGGIRGGQVYGSSDAHGAFPHTQPCTPADIHATIFHALGISPRAELHDMLNRPHPVSDGEVLPL